MNTGTKEVDNDQITNKQDLANGSEIASPLNDKRLQCADLVRRWGGSASITSIDETCEIFSAPDIEGIIGYRSAPGCIIVFGDPVCSPEDMPQLTEEFHRFCENQKKRIVYLSVTQKFADWAMKHVCNAIIEFGEELIINPSTHQDPSEGSQGRMLRKKVNHALNKGTVAKEYIDYDEKLEKEIENVGENWLKARQGPQIYLSHVHILKDRSSQRWFYAEHAGKVVGAILLTQLQVHQGWLLYFLMTTPDAPNGTSELMIMKVLEALHNEKSQYLTFGAVTSAELGKMEGLGTITTILARNAFKITKKLFHLDGRRDFWKKFQPASEGSYVLFSHPHVGLREFYGVMRALNVSL